MTRYLVYGIDFVVDVLQLMLFTRAVLSWFITNTDSWIGSFYNSLVSLTEWLVSPVRRLMNKIFGQSRLDWSIVIVFFLVRIIGYLLVALISSIF